MQIPELTSPPLLSVSEIAPGNIQALLTLVMRRISNEVRGYDQSDASVFPVLAQRVHQAMQGQVMGGGFVPDEPAYVTLLAEVEADLRELSTVPAERLRYVVQAGAISARGHSAQTELGLRAERQRQLVAQQEAAMCPRVSPGEMIQAFAARGVSIRVKGQNLEVKPAAVLTDADRTALREMKQPILAALATACDTLSSSKF